MKNRVTILLLVLFASISAGTWYIFKEALSVRASREGTDPSDQYLGPEWIAPSSTD